MASKLPLLILLIAITCLSQFYRVSNSVIAPELTRDLGLSARQLGWAGSAFFFALFAVQVPVGMWFDHFGARRTVAVLSFLAMVGALWIAAAADAFDLIGGRAVVGVGCAASFMSVVFLCSRWFPPAEARHRALLGIRRFQHRHPGGCNAARLDRRDRRLAQRLPGPRRRHRPGRRGVLCFRARPAARPARAGDPARELSARS